MLIHELTEDECRDILRRTNLARLACSRNDQPYIVPIHFDFDGGSFFSFSTLGQKIDWMRANPKVCVEVEDIADEKHWTTVLVFGRYEEIQRTAAAAELRSRAEQLFQQRQQWWFPAAAQVGSRQHDHLVVYRIDIDRLTGRQAARSG